MNNLIKKIEKQQLIGNTTESEWYNKGLVMAMYIIENEEPLILSKSQQIILD